MAGTLPLVEGESSGPESTYPDQGFDSANWLSTEQVDRIKALVWICTSNLNFLSQLTG